MLLDMDKVFSSDEVIIVKEKAEEGEIVIGENEKLE